MSHVGVYLRRRQRCSVNISNCRLAILSKVDILISYAAFDKTFYYNLKGFFNG